jgi:hypothetical protein
MVNREFLTAGKATFTVDNGRGDWQTYKVAKSRDEANPVYFVSVMDGPDNQSSYAYIGLLDPNSGEMRVTRKSRYAEDHRFVRIARFALRVVFGKQELPAGYDVKHAGRCGRCNRMLTTPESLASGIGPECAGRIARAKVQEAS